MAQENITASMFMDIMPRTPEQQQAEFQAQRDLMALKMAQLPAGAGVRFAGFQAAQDLGRALGDVEKGIRQGLFGIETQKEVEDRLSQQIRAGGADILRTEGLGSFLNYLSDSYGQAGLTDKATKAKLIAEKIGQQQEVVKSEITKNLAAAKKSLAERQPTPRAPIQVDLGDRIQIRDPITNQVLEEIQKGLTPEQQRKATEAGAEERPGFLGKTGAYRNQFGEVIPGSEMQKQRTGFQAAEDLLSNLNKITATDIRNAEAKIDYTQGEARKAVAGTFFKKALDAQTKIAASQLLQQIESLPPGSASDADMRAAARAFPGYSNATALLNWVNRTKETLEQSLARQNEQYGFSRRVKASNPLEFGGKTGTTASAKKPAGVSDAEWNAMTPEEKALWK